MDKKRNSPLGKKKKKMMHPSNTGLVNIVNTFFNTLFFALQKCTI